MDAGAQPEDPAGRAADPLAMSAAERLACEWEARHDVQARAGRLADPAAVAHYVAHARRDDLLRSGRAADGHQRAAGRPHPSHPVEDPAHPAWLRGWLRWGEDGGSDHRH